MQRALSNMERAFWLLDRGHPFNGVQVVSVTGPLSEKLLIAALRRLEQRHPAMRMRIVPATPGDERRLLLTDEGAGPIPLTVVPRESDRTWQEIAVQELNQRFSDDSNHLSRLVWVCGPDKSELVFGQHHVTCDALSIAYAVRDLLADLAALASGAALPQVESLPLRPPLPSLLPASTRGLRRLRHMQAFFYKHVLLRPLRRAAKLPLEQRASPAERRSGLIHDSLSPKETRALAETARQERTTVHAALCAALLLSTGETAFAGEGARRRRVILGCATAVNLRRELSSPVGEEMGLFISQVTTFHRVSSRGLSGQPPALWQLAREVRAQLLRSLRNGEQYLTMPLIGLFVPRGRRPGPRFVRRFDCGSPAALAVTNIGSLPIPLVYGPFTVESCQFAVSPSVVSPLVVTASTCGGTLNLNLIHVTPLCSAERAAAILDGALRRLR